MRSRWIAWVFVLPLMGGCFNYDAAYSQFCASGCAGGGSAQSMDGGIDKPVDPSKKGPVCAPIVAPGPVPTPGAAPWRDWNGTLMSWLKRYDFDGDGRDDWLMGDDGVNAYRWVGLNAQNELTSHYAAPVGGQVTGGLTMVTAQHETSGDFDGDGRSDVWVSGPSGWAIVKRDFFGRPFALLTYPIGTELPGGWTVQQADFVNSGDFNGDGHHDAFVQGMSGAGFVIAQAAAELKTQARIPLNGEVGGWKFTSADRVIALFNLQGDCREEVVLRNLWGIAVVFLNDDGQLEVTARSENGATIAAAGVPEAFSITTDTPLIGSIDLDGNGIYELLFQDTHTARLGIVALENGVWVTKRIIDTNNVAYAIADLDGGGKAELIWKTTQGWSVVKLSLTAAPQPLVTLPFGTAIGNWTLSADDDFDAPGRYVRSDRQALILQNQSHTAGGVVEFAEGTLRLVARTD